MKEVMSASRCRTKNARWRASSSTRPSTSSTWVLPVSARPAGGSPGGSKYAEGALNDRTGCACMLLQCWRRWRCWQRQALTGKPLHPPRLEHQHRSQDQDHGLEARPIVVRGLFVEGLAGSRVGRGGSTVPGPQPSPPPQGGGGGQRVSHGRLGLVSIASLPVQSQTPPEGVLPPALHRALGFVTRTTSCRNDEDRSGRLAPTPCV